MLGMDRITGSTGTRSRLHDLKLIRMKHAASLCKANEVTGARRHGDLVTRRRMDNECIAVRAPCRGAAG